VGRSRGIGRGDIVKRQDALRHFVRSYLNSEAESPEQHEPNWTAFELGEYLSSSYAAGLRESERRLLAKCVNAFPSLAIFARELNSYLTSRR
jgi:hypothetical protein